ncbi:MAG: helix-turn-helix domain-containing protein [Clostridiaceae bacterium]
MRILSTGEKIKRARIYKGLTLKELGKDVISVSKLSCIENGKLIPEYCVLEFLAEELDLNLEYLKLDAKEQMKKNFEILASEKSESNYAEKAIYNYNYCIKINEVELGSKFLNLLFCYYLDNNMLDEIDNFLDDLPKTVGHLKKMDNLLLYNFDLGKYLFKMKEYKQADYLFNYVYERFDLVNEEKYKLEVLYYYCWCKFILKDIVSLEKAKLEMINLTTCVEDKIILGKVFNLLCCLYGYEDEERVKEYEIMSFEYLRDDLKEISYANLNLSLYYFSNNEPAKGKVYIERGLDEFPKDNKKLYLEYLLSVVEVLFSHKEYYKLAELVDEAIDISIELDDPCYLEKSYYYKGMICHHNDNYMQEEMYLTLSIDILKKNKWLYKLSQRYLDLSNLYYKMGNEKEVLNVLYSATKLKSRLFNSEL